VNVYVDASVVLRIVLGEPEPLTTWGRIDVAVSSELIRVECLRTIDRARIRLRLDDSAVARHRSDVLELIERMTLVRVDASVLARAADPFPTTLGSLDAIHLASASLARDQVEGMRLATHDTELATAALAMGFQVDGLDERPRCAGRAPTSRRR
jgi:predicted nucleic acid-binding protein